MTVPVRVLVVECLSAGTCEFGKDRSQSIARVAGIAKETRHSACTGCQAAVIDRCICCQAKSLPARAAGTQATRDAIKKRTCAGREHAAVSEVVARILHENLELRLHRTAAV